MISLLVIFSILVTHYFADFIMQDEEWATNKSKSIKALLKHTVVYTTCWIPVISILGLLTCYSPNMLWFIPITFVLHTLTDYITSRIVSKKFAKGEFGSPIPNTGAFSVIGFDQLLHYSQLFLTYYLLR